MTRWFPAILLALLLAGCGAQPSGAPAVDSARSRLSDGALYQVSYTPSIDPVPLNTLHTWTVHVETAAGVPVTGASLKVTGGMPEHNHGMPTSPQMTADLQEGDYRIEGMKFQMAGHWTVTVTIQAAQGNDAVTFDLILQ